MPDQKQKYTSISFDRDEIRKRTTKLSFKEARRQRGPIYDVLIRELYEEGCTTVGCHFKNLVEEEKRLRVKANVICSVHEEPELLIKLFDNVKNAELAARLGQCNGMLACLMLLYQSINLVEVHSTSGKYEWLLNEMYEIILRYVLKLDPDLIILNEMRAKIYYKYGSYFFQRRERLDWMIEVLTKALDLCKGQIWEADMYLNEDLTMHDVVARKLVKLYLAYAQKFLPNNPEEAMHLSMKAILVIAECGLEKNMKVLCYAYLAKIEFLIECHKFDMALKDIRKVRNQIETDDRTELIKVKCQLSKFTGVCYYNLNNPSEAFVNFQNAYILSRNYSLRSLMGEIWLWIGKTHAKLSRGKGRARDAFEMSRSIFRRMNDIENMKKAEYMLAKLRADKIFPRLLQMIKSKDYCDFYNLRQWKNQCEPFWEEEVNLVATQKSVMIIKARRTTSIRSEMRDSQVRQSISTQARVSEFNQSELQEDDDQPNFNLDCLLGEDW